LFTYQIHIPLPSNAVPDGGPCVEPGGGVVVGRGSLRIRSGDVEFDRTPFRPVTYSRPERALAGTPTVTRDPDELRGFMLRIVGVPSARRTGNITRAPAGRRKPASFTIPPGATVRWSVQERMHLTQIR
jgi:hypothetical protein